MSRSAAYLPVLVSVAVCAGVAYAGDRAPETDGEIWNRGVDLYREGNFTNALAVLKPLILSKTHGPRAAELVGAIEFAEGMKRGGEGVSQPLASLENAVSDFQLALRSAPDDPRMNRNFTRAADRIPELREQARVERVMKELGQQDPGALLGAAVKDVRALLAEFPAALTNDARRTVPMCDAMAKRAEKLGDTWIAVKAGVAQSVTNEQQAMTINMQVEEARSATEEAADALADIDPAAMERLEKAETSFTRFWKLAVLPPAACDEALLAQTNGLLMVENAYGRDWQRESLDFTRAFRAKFPAWAQAYEQQAQADTNKPPFTKEAQAEIERLAAEAETIQQELVRDGAESAKVGRKGGGKAAERAAKQFDVLKKLTRIRELLPKDGNGGGQNQQNRQDQNRNQDKKEDDQKNQDKNQDKDQDKNQDEEQRQDQDPKDEKKEEEKEDQTSEQPEDRKDEEVEDVLRRAQERSDQHEADKKARMNRIPLPANERDW